MFWKMKSQNVSSNFGFLGFTTSNALLPPLPPHIGIFTVQCSPVNWLFQTFELHRQKCSIMASTLDPRSSDPSGSLSNKDLTRSNEMEEGVQQREAPIKVDHSGGHWFKRRSRPVLRIIHFPSPLKSASSQMEGFLDSSADCEFEFIPHNRWKSLSLKDAVGNMYRSISRWALFKVESLPVVRN